jgi:hypothetical protein
MFNLLATKVNFKNKVYKLIYLFIYVIPYITTCKERFITLKDNTMKKE